MMSRKITTMTGLRRCPECERQQFPIICNCDSAGYVDVVQCKYCGAKFHQKDNPIIPWNKGLIDPNAKTRDPDYYRRESKQRYWADPDYYRMKSREWEKSPRGRAYKREYERKPHVKERRAAYARTEKGKEIRRNWKDRNRQRVKCSNVKWLVKMQKILESNQSDPRHGTNNGYRYGCRCDRCKQAHSEHNRRWYARRRAS